jgi:hypothetical protein
MDFDETALAITEVLYRHLPGETEKEPEKLLSVVTSYTGLENQEYGRTDPSR